MCVCGGGELFLLCLPIHPCSAFKTQFKSPSGETALIPTLSLHHGQIWLQIHGLGPFNEFSRSDHCFLKFLEVTWFLLQSLIIRASAMWDAGNQLCSCEIFDLKQDSRLLKGELCKLRIVQWAGGPHCEPRLGGSCCSSTPASFPPGPSHFPASAQLYLGDKKASSGREGGTWESFSHLFKETEKNPSWLPWKHFPTCR